MTGPDSRRHAVFTKRRPLDRVPYYLQAAAPDLPQAAFVSESVKRCAAATGEAL